MDVISERSLLVLSINQIYERTLDLVAAKLTSMEDVESSSSPAASAAGFAYSDLISTTNLELIANLSGCEAHRRGPPTKDVGKILVSFDPSSLSES